MSQAFPVIDHLIHLNHAAVGPWPRVTAQAVQRFAQENADVGSRHYPRWMRIEQELRQRLAVLVNARGGDEIALVKNTSEGLSFVAYGLAWGPGDNIVGIRQEFPSNRFVWDSLAGKGVAFRKLDMEGLDDPEQGLFDLCDGNTRLIAISAVQFHNGLRMDLARVGDFCRERGILFCIDGIQQIGCLPFDAQAVGADFAIADGHKWMLAPEGLGVFYVREEVMNRLDILQYGWHMTEHQGDYTSATFEPASSARRFECGSPNMLGIHALHASAGLLLAEGMSNIGGKVLDNTRYLIERLASIDGIELISNRKPQRQSGIVTFRCRKAATDQLYRHLGEHNVLCAPRGGGVRLSPHYYTPREQLDQVIDLIREFAR